ncbi:MAG: hypothetical protein P4M15_12870 [Alphaproteobacteria bacterium]|nr:hypothetical protein [Alphaproteobacteria bacterium]
MQFLPESKPVWDLAADVAASDAFRQSMRFQAAQICRKRMADLRHFRRQADELCGGFNKNKRKQMIISIAFGRVRRASLKFLPLRQVNLSHCRIAFSRPRDLEQTKLGLLQDQRPASFPPADEAPSDEPADPHSQ